MGKARHWPEEEQQWLRDVLEYDAETGIITWKVDRQKNKAGSILKYQIKSAGYLEAYVKNKDLFGNKQRRYLVHRLAYFLHTGEQHDHVDHENRDPSDNRFENLRPCTHQQNCLNRIKRGYGKHMRGVDVTKNGTYRARLFTKGKSKHLGVFETEIEAHLAWKAAYEKKAEEFSIFLQE